MVGEITTPTVSPISRRCTLRSFFFPSIPLASYRVKSEGGGRYHFLGKGPLKAAAFIGPAIAAVAILLFDDPGQYCGHQHITTGADCSQQFG